MEHSSSVHYFHDIFHQGTLLWGEIWPVISSLTALRIYALVIIAFATLVAALTAYRAKKTLTKIQNAALKMEFPGPDPVKEDSIEKRRKVLEENAEKELRPFRGAMLHLFVSGFFVPTAAFALCAINYAWFDPSGLPFFDRAQGQPIQFADASTIGWFILNQFGHGALFDVLEVFDIDISVVSNNPSNWWFSGTVFLYRTMISAFVVALVIAVAQFIHVNRDFDRKIKAKIQEFNNAARAT